MAIVEEKDLRYSMESMRAVELIQRRMGESLYRIADERVRSSGRNVVTAEDILSGVTDELLSLIESPAESEHGR